MNRHGQKQTFHFVRYKYGTVEAENEQSFGNGRYPRAPKQSPILIIISKKKGTPVFPNLSQAETADKLVNLETSIIWTEQYFEEKALELERKAGHFLFDRDKFTSALYQMIAAHDRQTGISWSTVEYYLNMLCKNNS